jgi:hypothetical protein
MWPLCECDNSTPVCRKNIFTYVFLFKLNKFVLNTVNINNAFYYKLSKAISMVLLGIKYLIIILKKY